MLSGPEVIFSFSTQNNRHHPSKRWAYETKALVVRLLRCDDDDMVATTRMLLPENICSGASANPTPALCVAAVGRVLMGNEVTDIACRTCLWDVLLGNFPPAIICARLQQTETQGKVRCITNWDVKFVTHGAGRMLGGVPGAGMRVSTCNGTGSTPA